MTALASPDEDVAREALGYLFDGSRAGLDRYLQHACNLGDPQVRADLAQTSFVRLWLSRATFENKGKTAWRGWLHKTASRCYVDYLRARRRLASEEEFDLHAVPSDERPIVDAMLTAVESEELFRIADRLFLELDPGISTRLHDRRLLAAKLFYIDGEPWQTVLRLLGPPPPGEPALNRQELDRWLSDPGVLRHLVFQTLFYDNDRLTVHLLGWPEMASGHERAQALERLMRQAQSEEPTAICGLTEKGFVWADILVILWRFRHAILADQIRARSDQTLTDPQFERLVEQCIGGFPFAAKMRQLVAKAVPDGNSETSKAIFATTGLWQRLALEYRLREDLPHRDILDRARPAADVVGCELTAGMLNVWLSNGRLVKRVAQKYREIHGDLEETTKNA